MSRAAIELDDVVLVVQTDDDEPPLTFPAVALVREAGLVVGAAAERRRRLEPRLIHDRFWSELSTEPLRRPYPPHVSAADVVHAHLEHCWQEVEARADEVLVTVPGDVDHETLGLVLGIARAAAVPVVGFVDAAVAAAADLGLTGPATHLEIFRSRVVATVLDFREPDLVKCGFEVEDGTGLAAVEAGWARLVAGELVRASRFDPLDRAETEQDLHDRLWGWVDEARRRGAVRLAMTAGERVHAVDVAEELFADGAATTYGAIDELVARARSVNGSTRLLLGHRVASLPRLAERLRGAPGLEVSRLPLAAAANGALRHAGAIVSEGDEVSLVVELGTGTRWQLPLAKPMTGGPEVRPAAGMRPTHLVHRGIAHPIPAAGLVVGLAPPVGTGALVLTAPAPGVSRSHLTLRREGRDVVVEDHSRYGTLLNDEPVDGAPSVVAGDRLRVGSPAIELELVTVTAGHGTP